MQINTFIKYSNLRNGDANFSRTGSKYLHIHLASPINTSPASSLDHLDVGASVRARPWSGRGRGGALKQILGSRGHVEEEWIGLFGHWQATGAQQNHLLGVKQRRRRRREEKVTLLLLPTAQRDQLKVAL